MNMNDLKSGEPFFDDWLIDSYIGKTRSGTAFKIYREQDGLREFNIMKVIEIPRDKYDQCASSEPMEDEVALYYKELATDVYRKVRLLENLPERQHIVSYEDHVIYQRSNQPGYEIFIRMEFLEGFRNSINAEFMTYQDVILLGRNICEALDLCERYHIIHGDIQPDCIYLSEHGQYKLGGFSLLQSQEEESDGQSNSLRTSEYSEYTAPEIMTGQPYDRRADIYSLGLVLYTCLNHYELPTDLRYKPLPENGTKELGQVILKACEFLPDDRYQSAKEFQEALIAVSVFLGDFLTDRIYPDDMEDAEIYVAATQEDKSECDKILQQEAAHKQLQEELQQELKSELLNEPANEQGNAIEPAAETKPEQKPTSELKSESKYIKKQKGKNKKALLNNDSKKEKEKEKDELRVSLISLKRTKNMGPWVLAIWTSVLTIAVLIIFIKSDFVLNNDRDDMETLTPTYIVQPTNALAESKENKQQELIPSVTVPDEEIKPTQEASSEGESPNPETEIPEEKESVMLLHSKEELESLDQMELLDEAEVMDFSENLITDITPLSSSSKVETLKLNHNAIHDVRPLKTLTTLKELDLSDNNIVTVVSLKELKNLEVLSLSNNLLPNILGLEKLTKLQMLYLDGNDIGDVSKLRSLKSLVFLDLSNNRLTEDQILKLQKALPNCIISY